MACRLNARNALRKFNPYESCGSKVEAETADATVSATGTGCVAKQVGSEMEHHTCLIVYVHRAGYTLYYCVKSCRFGPHVTWHPTHPPPPTAYQISNRWPITFQRAASPTPVKIPTQQQLFFQSNQAH